MTIGEEGRAKAERGRSRMDSNAESNTSCAIEIVRGVRDSGGATVMGKEVINVWILKAGGVF